MPHEFEVKLSAFNVGPNADANNRAGIIAPAPSSAEVLRQIAADVKGDFAFALAGILMRAADELERKFDIDAALVKLTRYDDVYRYGETVMLAVGEDNPRGNGEYVRFDDVREVLEGMIDAQHKAG
jgi:hypothetical protein